MKKLFAILMTTSIVTGLWAQTDNLKDLIYTNDNEVVEAKIMEVSSKEVRYKEWDNQNGATFILTADELKKIEFSNGTVKTFSAPAPAATPAATPAAPKTVEVNNAADKAKLPAGFQFNADLEGNLAFQNAFYINDYHVDAYASGGLSVSLGAGARIGKFLYVGAAAGVLGEWGSSKVKAPEAEGKFKATASAYVVPIYADVRVYAPTSSNCYPFAEVGIGGYVGLDGKVKGGDYDPLPNKPAGGFYFVSGVGVEFKYLTVGAGYKLLRNTDVIGNHGYVKIGVSLGRNQKIRQ